MMGPVAAVAAGSVQGRRPSNEDEHIALGSIEPELPDHSLLAVFDGHGGEVAAQLAERHLLATLCLQPHYQQYVQGWQQQQQRETPDYQCHADLARQLGSALRAALLALDAT
jgi:serine/threonine protein phosphatase PrpC